MAKAPHGDQLRLLDLQALDSRIVKIDRSTKTLSTDPAITAAASAATEAAGARDEVGIEVVAAQRAITDSEHEVEKVQARMDKDRRQIDAGKGTARDMMALQHEIDSLTTRKATLEDEQLELMETLEAVSARGADAERAAEQAAGQLAGLEQERYAQLASLAQQRAKLAAERATLAASLDAGLVAIYEKRLAQHGIGAARLFHGTSEGSGMQLAPGDLAEIKTAAEDDVVFCPDSGCILVRSPEWA